MKRITFLIVAFIMISGISSLSAKSTASIPSYFVNENFDGLSALPTGWTTVRSPYGNSGVTAPTINSNKLQYYSASASANRGVGINFPTSGSEQIVYLDFDWQVGLPSGTFRNSGALMFHDNTTPATPKDILALYLGPWGETDVLHCWNMKIADTATYAGSMQTYPWFNRVNSLNLTNAGTIITNGVTQLGNGGSPFSHSLTYNIKATLNFSTHQVTYLKVTKLTDNTFVEKTNLPFIDNTAATVGEISFTATRSSNSGNGGNSGWTTQIDNLKIYKLIDVSTASVTINYKDAGGNLLKTSRVQSDLEVGTTYTVPTTDKATFTDALNYYSYDAVATVADNVVVAEGAVINLVFKTTPITAGNYVWTGTANSNWNNGDANFTPDNGVTNIGYQDNNPVWFPAVVANKTVNLDADLTVGANDITLAGDAYSLSGIGSVAGSGQFILNLMAGETVTMGIKNNMAGVTLNGGTAVITNDLGSAAYTVADGGKLILQSGASFSKSIAGSGTLNIEAASNNNYSMPITGASTVNIQLDNAGSGTSATWTDYFSGSFPSGAQINVTTGLAAAGFGVYDGLLTNNKVNLGDGIRLLRWYNQATSGGGTSTIVVGELSGTANSTVEGGMVDANNRHLAYEIGGLGTDATFDGVIKNFGTVTQANLNIYKKGNGTWTLNGASTYSPGLFNVDAGTVIMNGSLTGTAVPVTVASGATLKGTGTIAGATTVNGTLEGNLNFGGTLALTGTTKFVVNGVNTGEFDAIDVVGDVNLGGAVEVTVNTASGVKGVDKVRNANPPVGTRIKLINAGSITTSLSPIHYPSTGWTFVPATGELVYDPSNVVTGLGNNSIEFRIYPTLTRDNVNIEGNVIGIEIINLAGQKVKQLQANGTKTVVSINNLSAGAYFVKALMVDGSVNVQNVILQK